MAELGHNYNIQCMKLFQELKQAFPSVPDEVVKQCMKQNRNDKGKCGEDLSKESQNYFLGRYSNRNGGKYASSRPRRFSVDAISLSESSQSQYGYSGGSYVRKRTNSFSESRPKLLAGLNGRGVNTLQKQRSGHEPCDDLVISNCDSEITPSRSSDDCNKGFSNRVIKHLEHKHEICAEQNQNSRVSAQNFKETKLDDENNNRLVNVAGDADEPDTKKNVSTKKKTLPRPLSISQSPDALDFIPTVVLTPDSPPQDSTGTRTVKTLYTPNESKIETTIIESEDLFFSSETLEQEIKRTIKGNSDNGENDSVLICGSNNTLTKSCIDILPGIGPINLPFGNSSISEIVSSVQDHCCIVSTATTSLTQGTVHLLKDVGNGNISIATTSFCGVQKSVVSPCASGQSDKPSTKSTTVLYTVNKKPIICENPFRKVFAKRKEFYQAKEAKDRLSPETSSKKLIWHHTNHNCNRLSPDPSLENIPPTPKYFTLNANIQPFDPFIIKHDLTADQDNRNVLKANPWCSSVNLTLCPNSSSNTTSPVEMLPDGSGLKYLSRVEIPEDGSEACLEVKVNLDGSTITTKRTGKSDCTSNEISVQLMDGGNQVNIQQNQMSHPKDKPVRPSSLHIPGSKYATSRHAQSVYQGRGSSPQSIPRYNSLPTLKSILYDNHASNASWDYQSHPKDEEKRLAYTRALLTHQMEQLFKLEKELQQGKKDMSVIKNDVKHLEVKLKQQEIGLQRHAAKTMHVEVKQLEHDIESLRGACDNMSKKVTNLTGGKVPLGDTSINFENYLTHQSNAVPEHPKASNDNSIVSPSASFQPKPSTNSDSNSLNSTSLSEPLSEEGKWSCSECTFSNHPSLDTCEICLMPRITLGLENLDVMLNECIK